MCGCREEGPPVECSQGLCHLWFGFQNLATKAFQTFQQSGHAIQKVSLFCCTQAPDAID